MAALGASLLVAPVNFVVLARAIAIRPGDLVDIVRRAVLGSVAMSAVLVCAQRALPVATTLPARIGWTAALVLAGAFVYADVVIGAWAVRRDAGSAEVWLLHRLLDRHRATRSSASMTG
jgi:hypothetical protein